MPTAEPTTPQALPPTDPSKVPVLGRASLVRSTTFATQYSTVAFNSSVLRIDPSTSKVTGRVDVPCAGYAVQIGTELWVVDDLNEALYVASVGE